MKVAIVAGEKSGDYLGAELIKAIKSRHPSAKFIGLCGPLMQSEGGISLDDMGKLSIMGFSEAIPMIKELFKIRKQLFHYFVDWQPDVFIGIDVPDFNLSLEKKLKDKGIPVVHYVSPSVWAWRPRRIKKIRRAIHHMLTLFPFEAEFYQRHHTPVTYVGHPMARKVLNWKTNSDIFQRFYSDQQKLIALLPGSRMSEVSRLSPTMLQAAKRISMSHPECRFVIPAASSKIRRYIEQECSAHEYPVEIIDGYSQDILSLCYMTILASGTAALEAALFAKPMVVMYQVSKINEFIARPMMVVSHYSLPNHLTKPPAVQEFVQQDANVTNITKEASKLLDDQDYYQKMQSALSPIAERLNKDSAELACLAIEDLLREHSSQSVQIQ